MAVLSIALIEETASAPARTNGAASPSSPTPKVEWGYVDEEGRLVLSPEMRRSLGLQPGATLRAERDGNTLRLHRPLNHLAKVYVEPTNACNLDCITCFRNAWQANVGRMREETFAAVLEGVRQIDPVPTLYFGGIGEPLFHPRTVEWVAEAKQLGARGADHQRHAADGAAQPPVDRSRTRPAVGFHRRRNAGKLRRRPPRRRVAQCAGEPATLPHAAQGA